MRVYRTIMLAPLFVISASLLSAQERTSTCDTTGLAALYAAAISKAAVYRRADVRKLYPAIPDTNGRVTVVTLTDWNGYKPGMNALSGNRFVWVTVVPEVQNICKGFKACRLLKLRELLGQPPASGTFTFVVMSVDVNDLFRPTPDPATGTLFPCSDTSKPDCGASFPQGLYDLDHKLWIADNLLGLYREGGYPWTHLGYTYNWAPDAKDIYGASEYVIRGGTTVRVLKVIGIDEYCDGGK
jgi:hypothetical protein